MTAQDLKNSILQLAMQGKLVPQDPNDEPASELLKRVKAEKVRLIKEGKIRKEKSQPAISKDEIPFDIPESWAWVRLGSAFSTVMGQSPEGSSVTEIEEGIEFHQGKIFFTDEIIAPSPQRTSKPTKIAPSGSILLCVRAPVGKVNITNRNICIGRGLAAIVTNGGILKKFTYYMLQTLETVFNQKANGSTFKAISSAIISNQVVPIPPISEQERIVEKIEELLPFIERYDESEKRLLELNKKFPDELRKSILQQAVQGKLTEQDPHDEPANELIKRIKAEKARLIKEGTIKKQKSPTPIREEEKPFEIPDNWIWCRVSDIVLQNLGGGTPAKNVPGYWGGDIPWASVKDLPMDDIWLNTTQDAITRSGLNNSSSNLIPRDNIIICTRMGLGKVVVNTIDVAINQDLRALLVSQYIHKMYLIHFFKSARLVGKGQTVKGITIDVLENMLLPLPPLEEQRRIVAKIDEVLPLCDRLK